MSQDLEKVLTQKLSEESIAGEIFDLEPLTGGASKEIWKFELKTKAQTEKYIPVSCTHLRAHETR